MTNSPNSDTNNISVKKTDCAECKREIINALRIFVSGKRKLEELIKDK